MRFVHYLRVETNRIFRSKTTWIFVALTAVLPLLGLTLFPFSELLTASTQLIINPVLTGTLGAAFLFALFTLLELDKVRKFNTFSLTEAIAPSMALHIARMGAIFIVSLATGLIVLIAYLPYTAYNMGSFFELRLYVSTYLIFMIPSMWIGSLFAAIFYQFFRRVDVSFIGVVACAFMSLNRPFFEDFILRWIMPNLPIFSDAFGNGRLLRMGIYGRVFWLLMLGGIWLVSLMFTRKYEKGAFGSLPFNIKKFYLPIAGAALILLSVNHYRSQPFYNNAPIEVDWEVVDDIGAALNITSISADITPDFSRGRMFGRIVYEIDGNVNGGKSRMIINSGYTVYSMLLDGEPIEFIDLNNDQFTIKHIEFEIPTGDRMELVVEYGGYPMLWGFSRLIIGGPEISRRNVDLMNHSVIPSLRVREAEIEVRLTLPEPLTLITLSGAVTDINHNGDGTKTWTLTDESDNIGIFAADYVRRVVEANDITVEFYHHARFTELLEKNNIDEVLSDVFKFCTERFGPLHYLEDDRLRLVQTSAHMLGGGAINGMSFMGEIAFSIYSLTDPLKGASGMELLAHEIIHQWWGLNRMFWEDDETPEWSAEGLTVYSTYRLYKEKFGEEFARINYVEEWQRAVDAMNRNFYRRHPEYLDIMPETFAATLRVNERMVMKYSLMPLKILRAEELVGGEEAFDSILAELSRSNQFEFLTYQEFLDACGLTKEDLRLD